METKIRWTNQAILNLNNIHNYISSGSKTYADRFISSLILTTEKQLQHYPHSGRPVPEFNNTQIHFLREVVFKGYRIIYNPLNVPERIAIISVMHGRMDVLRNIKSIWELD